MNENKIQHPNLSDAVKTALKEKIIAINAYIKNKKYVKSIKEQAKLKTSWRKEAIKVREEINETGNRKTI